VQYLYNSAVQGQSYNIKSKEELLTLVKNGVISSHSTLYDMENHVSIIAENIPEVQVWKILLSNKNVKRKKLLNIHKIIDSFISRIKTNTIYIVPVILTSLLILVTALLFNYTSKLGYGDKSTVNSNSQNQLAVNGLLQIHKDYINKKEPNKEDYSNNNFGEYSIVLQKYASGVIDELKSESELKRMGSELQEQKIETLLNTNDGFLIFQSKIEKMIFTIEKNLNERFKSRQELKNTILNINTVEKYKKLMLNTLENVIFKFDYIYIDYCKNEIDLLNSLYSQVEYLKNNTAKFRLDENGNIVFYNSKDLEDYSVIIMELENRVKKETDFIRKLNKIEKEIGE
jgi:hypothetical protein